MSYRFPTQLPEGHEHPLIFAPPAAPSTTPKLAQPTAAPESTADAIDRAVGLECCFPRHTVYASLSRRTVEIFYWCQRWGCGLALKASGPQFAGQQLSPRRLLFRSEGTLASAAAPPFWPSRWRSSIRDRSTSAKVPMTREHKVDHGRGDPLR